MAAGRDIGGGIARSALGRWTVWLKAGSDRSHGHADLCSVAILLDGKTWITADPGTGTYNGPVEVRNYFRSSLSHNVLRLAGEDQLQPHRAFRWRHSAGGVIASPVAGPDWILMWGAHDAYRRLGPPRRLARTVLIRPNRVVVTDWVEGPRGIPWDLSLPLPPGITFRPGSHEVVAGGLTMRLTLPARAALHTAETEPFDGWWSETYSSWTHASRLQMTGISEGSVTWAIIADPAQAPLANQEWLEDGDLRWQIRWTPAGPILDMPGRPAQSASLPAGGL